VYWDINLLQTYISKLDLDRRLLLQELPSLEDLAKITGISRPLITVINEEVDDLDREIAGEGEISRFKILTDIENEDVFRRLVNMFRHYCMAKNLVELGYTTVTKDIVTSIMLELPLYDPEYCRDEVRYVYERLRRENSPILKILSRYPICGSSSPLDVLAHMVLDLNLIGARGIVNDFFINFTSRPVSSVRNLLAAHMLFFSLPAVSLGSLIKLGLSLMSLLTALRVNILHADAYGTKMGEWNIVAHRDLIRKILDVLQKSSNILVLPRLLKMIQHLEDSFHRARQEKTRYAYYVVLMTLPRLRVTVASCRHINNLGLLVKSVMIV